MFEIAGRAPDGGSLRARFVGESLMGDPVDAVYLLPLGPAGRDGETRLAESAGLELREEDGALYVDMVTFAGPAEQLGVDFDWELRAVKVATARPPKEVFYLPALGLLAVVALVQRRRRAAMEEAPA